MTRKEVVQMCMESPLYFTMPVQRRLEFIKNRQRLTSANDLREDLLKWVKTGQFQHSDTPPALTPPLPPNENSGPG